MLMLGSLTPNINIAIIMLFVIENTPYILKLTLKRQESTILLFFNNQKGMIDKDILYR